MIRVAVDLEDAVYRTLVEVARQNGVAGVSQVLAAAGRHVAVTQGGLRRVTYRQPDIEIPERVEPQVKPARRPAVGPRTRHLSADALAQQDRVVRLYRIALLSLRETAERVDLSPATVRALLVDAQVPIRSKGWVPGKPRRAA